MKFRSDAERMQHPQARLIPFSLWKSPSFFFETLSDTQLALMHASKAELETIFTSIRFHLLNHKEKICLALALAYSHPDLNVQELLHLSELLALSKEQLLSFACTLGKIDFFQACTHSHTDAELKIMIAEHNYQAFRLACANSHLPLMCYLVEQAPQAIEDMIRADHYAAFHHAAVDGQLASLEYVIGLAPDKIQTMIAANQYAAVRLAAENGQLDVLKYLVKLVPTAIQTMITADYYGAFRTAVANEHFAVAEYIMELVPAQVQNMIEARDYSAFRHVAKKGHLNALDYLLRLTPEKVQEMIAGEEYEAFRNAFRNGHLDIMARLIELTPQEQLEEMITSEEYEAYHQAATTGQLDAMRFVTKWVSPDTVQQMIIDHDCRAFHYAAEQNQLAVMDYLITMEQKQIQKSIAVDNYIIFKKAALNGHFEVMERLMNLVPDQVQEMIAAENYYAFRHAKTFAVRERLMQLVPPNKLQEMITAKNYTVFNTLEPNEMEHLLSLIPAEQVSEMIAANNYFAFRCNDLKVMERLMELAPEKVQDMIAAANYGAFFLAAQTSNLAALNRLVELLTPDRLQDMLAAEQYRTFRIVAQHGQLAILEHLLALLAPDKVQEMIAAEQYDAFNCAASNGQLAIIRRLMELAPEKIQEMIAANNYSAFGQAAAKGYVAIINLFVELTPDKVEVMTVANNYHACVASAMNGHVDVLKRILMGLSIVAAKNIMIKSFISAVDFSVHTTDYLLHFPWVFAYAEAHEEFQNAASSFTSYRLKELRSLKTATEMANPNAVFDIENPDVTLLFYYLRSFIRRNNVSLLDDIRFLLEIPALKNIVHLRISLPGVVNELLRLAVRIGNEAAAQLLLSIPQVHFLAQQNNYYLEEARGYVNLRTLAEDQESSLHALSIGEQKRLDAVITRYQPVQQQYGTQHIMDSLRQILSERYEVNPARLMQQKEDLLVPLSLPINWQDFQALELSPAEKEEALRAYYQNKNHTVLRYFSKPNRWMHPEAEYVRNNRQNPEQLGELLAWSTFEEYQSLISLLFLAVFDKNVLPTDGHSLETRLEHFINELAHIGRAHNWDKTREIVDAENNLVLDANGEALTEEYDDLEGDRPSCYSGVKRRLFQSVIGHPLFNLLTKDILRQEIQEFALSHFRDAIQKGNPDLIKKAYNEIILGNMDEEKKEEEQAISKQQHFCLLKTLDIAPAQRDTFFSYLTEKYGTQLSEDETLLQWVTQTFVLKSDEAHILKLAYCGVDHLMQRLGIAVTLSKIGLHPRPFPEENEDELHPSKRSRYE